MSKQKLIVGISGASGIIYGIRMLEALRASNVETHLVMSKSAELTLSYESDLRADDVKALADHWYPVKDVGAAGLERFISDGGHGDCAMFCANHVKLQRVLRRHFTRAADVVLKERRKLVLMVRETPFHTGHLRTMTALSEMGAIIAPPLPAMYTRPESVDDIINHSVGRVLDLFELENDLVNRWGITSGVREPGRD